MNIPPLPPPPRPTQREKPASEEIAKGVAKGISRFVFGCFAWVVTVTWLLYMIGTWQMQAPDKGFVEFVWNYLTK